MIVRLVQMTFQEEHIEAFRSLFEERRHLIRGFDGCRHLELWQDKNRTNIFFTYSIWDSENHLEAYRVSELFQDTWARTKVLFGGKPEAWTLNSNTPFVGIDKE